MTETKPRYELKRRSENYVLLCEGDHSLCSICIKKPRGALDAQLILLVMNSHKDLLAACNRARNVMDQPAVIDNLPAPLGDWITMVVAELNAAINNTKPKAEKEGSGE